MDIKGFARNLWPIDIIRAKNKTPEVRAQSSTDREGDGRQPQQEAERRKLSEEEFQAAMEHLRELPGVKDNGLVVRWEVQNEMRVVYIEDATGKTIRRIVELDLLSLMGDRKKSKGQIFDKAM